MSFSHPSTPTTPVPLADEGYMEEEIAHIYALQADAFNANQVEDLISGRGSLRDTEGVWHECGVQCGVLSVPETRARLQTPCNTPKIQTGRQSKANRAITAIRCRRGTRSASVSDGVELI